MFLFLFTLLPLFLYIEGSLQGFLDDTLFKLLLLYSFSTLVFIAVGISYIIILIVLGKNTGRRLGVRTALVTAGVLVSASAFFITQIIITGLQPV